MLHSARAAPMAYSPHANTLDCSLQALKDGGVREIFGIPGDFVQPLFKVTEERNILGWMVSVQTSMRC